MRALERLGAQTPDLAGLHALYASRCFSVPFDNIRKLIAHAEGSTKALPGTDADDFLQNWMEHGTGGTCWPSSNALYEVARAAGFDASRSTASMWDRGVATHGTVIARVEGGDWAIDSSILTVTPLPLVRGNVHVQPDPLHPVEVEWNDGAFVFWFEAANYDRQFPCRLLEWQVEHSVYAERYEASRTTGPFNERLFVRRNRPGRLLMLVGNRRWERTVGGQTARLLSEEELVAELLDEHGYSKTIIDRWIQIGGLEAAMKEPEPTPPPPLTRVPPSMR